MSLSSMYLSMFLYAILSINQYICLSIYLYIDLCIDESINLSISSDELDVSSIDKTPHSSRDDEPLPG